MKTGHCKLFNIVVRSSISVNSLEFHFLVFSCDSELTSELPLRNLIAKLFHDKAHHIVALSVDDHGGMIVNRSLLEVDYDKIASSL